MAYEKWYEIKGDKVYKCYEPDGWSYVNQMRRGTNPEDMVTRTYWGTLEEYKHKFPEKFKNEME